MKVYVNDREVNLMAGMKVKHAVIAAELMDQVKQGGKVYDDAGHEIGLDGALTDGVRIYVR